MRSDLPTGTVTFVFTDVEGSTRLLDELGTEGYAAALAEHRRVVREACATHGGVEVDTQGDAFFVAFVTAPGALAACARFTNALADGPLRVRVGLHTGTPLLVEEGYVGQDVHRAARIMSAAHGGQVVLSRETAELLPEAAFVLVDLGEHRFKDIGAPERVFQLGEADFPPLRTIANTNLPTPASSFVGRTRELADAAEILTASRIVTVIGPGGAGKTRFALELARRAREERFSDYRDGVFWVPLATLRDSSLVLDSVARVLGSSDDPTGEIGEKRQLFLLDNLEQVLAAAPALSGLVKACPNVTVLCTSRELLHVDGEHAYELPPLDKSEGVALFGERSGVEPGEAVAALCLRLEGLPLAIELAAARARVLSPAQILARVTDRLDLFRGGVDADPRHATLRATIAWSHDLLDVAEQHLFARLSVFRGGCTLEAAEAVCAADLDTMQSLLDKSLLRRRDNDAERRFWMLETVREFAHERLDESGEADDVRKAHAEWFCALARPRDGDPWSASTERIDQLELELDNFRAVHELLVDEADAGRALQLAVDLHTVWEMRDRIVEGDRWLERALSLPGCTGSVARGLALGARGSLAYFLGELEACRAYMTEAVLIMRSAGTDEELARALLGTSWVVRHEDLTSARATLEEALILARRADTPRILRTTLHNLGEVERNAGAYERGAALLEEALSLARELDDAGWEGAISHSLADLELYRGCDDAAWVHYLHAAGVSLAQQIPQQIGLCVGGLAAVAARRGQLDIARRLWAALEHWERERGVRLQPVERSHYEEAVVGLEPDEQPALSLEQAIELAATSTPRLAP